MTQAEKLRKEADDIEAAELLAERLATADKIPTCECGSRSFTIYAYGEASQGYEYDDEGEGSWDEDGSTGDHGDESSSAYCAECGADVEALLTRFGWHFYETQPKGQNAALVGEVRETELYLTQTLMAVNIGKRTAQQRLDFVLSEVKRIRDRQSVMLARINPPKGSGQ